MDKLATELSRKGITEEMIRNVVGNPDEVLYDSATGRWVALKMNRRLAVVYEAREEETFIITIIYSSKLDEVARRRKRSGRWIPS
jgi:DNA polymerase III delta subunit